MTEIPGKRKPRVLIDYRRQARERFLARQEAVEEQEARYARICGADPGPPDGLRFSERKVLEPYYPREPIDAGDGLSPSGTQIAFEELDESLQALILAGAGGGVRVRELDGSPDVDPVDDIRVPNGSIVSAAGSAIQFLFADYMGSFELANPGPGTGDIPTGRWAFWYDTTNGMQFLVRNRGGTLFYVELTN